MAPQSKPEDWKPNGRSWQCQAWARTKGRQCRLSAAPGEQFCSDWHLDKVEASKDPNYPKERVKKEDILPKRRTKAVPCRGINKDGKTSCGRTTKNPSRYCYQHLQQDPHSPLRRAEDDAGSSAAASTSKAAQKNHKPRRNIAKHCNFGNMTSTAQR